MNFNVYLNFDGNAEEALNFYNRVLGGELVVNRVAGTPAEAHMPAGWGDKIMHGELRVNDQVIMAADAPPEFSTKPGGFSVSVSLKDATEGKRIFEGLAEGGQVTMGWEKTFWAEGFGMLVDRFGIPWIVNAGS